MSLTLVVQGLLTAASFIIPTVPIIVTSILAIMQLAGLFVYLRIYPLSKNKITITKIKNQLQPEEQVLFEINIGEDMNKFCQDNDLSLSQAMQIENNIDKDRGLWVALTWQSRTTEKMNAQMIINTVKDVEVIKEVIQELTPRAKLDLKIHHILKLHVDAGLIPHVKALENHRFMRELGGDNWLLSEEPKLFELLEKMTVEYIVNHARCPFCGCHETFSRNQQGLKCENCHAVWVDKNITPYWLFNEGKYMKMEQWKTK